MRKTVKLIIAFIMISACLLATVSCQPKKPYKNIEGYWVSEDENTDIVIRFTSDDKASTVVIMDNHLDEEMIYGGFIIDETTLTIVSDNPSYISALGGSDTRLITTYSISEDGKNLTLTYAGKTVTLERFDKDLSNPPTATK